MSVLPMWRAASRVVPRETQARKAGAVATLDKHRARAGATLAAARKVVAPQPPQARAAGRGARGLPNRVLARGRPAAAGWGSSGPGCAPASRRHGAAALDKGRARGAAALARDRPRDRAAMAAVKARARCATAPAKAKAGAVLAVTGPRAAAGTEKGKAVADPARAAVGSPRDKGKGVSAAAPELARAARRVARGGGRPVRPTRQARAARDGGVASPYPGPTASTGVGKSRHACKEICSKWQL